jgi:hypothetical protein
MHCRTLLAPIAIITILGSSISWRHERRSLLTFQFQYAAKVVCGTPRQLILPGRPAPPPPPVVTQAYATSINVNNPSDSLTVFLRKRLVITYPPGFQIPQKALRPVNDSLVATYALLTDCSDLRKRFDLAQPFFEGFVVIQSALPLDVTAVYTVAGGIDVVPVAERKIFVGQ